MKQPREGFFHRGLTLMAGASLFAGGVLDVGLEAVEADKPNAAHRLRSEVLFTAPLVISS
jgi:hypothetical protein